MITVAKRQVGHEDQHLLQGLQYRRGYGSNIFYIHMMNCTMQIKRKNKIKITKNVGVPEKKTVRGLMAFRIISKN